MNAPDEKIPAVLLCGGTSERLGFPKEMLRVDGAPLAVRLVERLKEVFESVSLISNRPEYLEYCAGVPVWRDEFPGAGPLAGLQAGLKRAGAERCFFLACDMPLAHNGMVRALLARAEASRAQAVIAHADGADQPLMGVYSAELVGQLEAVLSRGRELSMRAFLETVRVERVEFAGTDAACLGDVDTAADLHLLKDAFSDVEPLPVSVREMTRFGAAGTGRDAVVEEWPLAVFANGTRLATVMCMPTAARELAVGFLAYLGLVRGTAQLRRLDVDYGGRRVMAQLDVEDGRISSAIQLLVTSTCGANVYGGALPELQAAGARPGIGIRRSHILECLAALRPMAPVFAATGCTHQAAFSDGERIRYFFEDTGRHNAVDKIAGAAILEGRDLSGGLLVTTGRLNSEMVVKALRARAGVLASRGAVTSNSVLLAEKHGLTLAGFARGGRINVYTSAERIIDE